MKKKGTTSAKTAFSDKLDAFLSRRCVALVKGFARAVVLLSIISSVITTLGLFGGGFWAFMFGQNYGIRLMSSPSGILLVLLATLGILLAALIVGAILAAIEIGSALITAGFIYSFARIAENRQTPVDASAADVPNGNDGGAAPAADRQKATVVSPKETKGKDAKSFPSSVRIKEETAATYDGEDDGIELTINCNVGAGEYAHNGSVNYLYVASGVERIGARGFAHCKNLRSVVLHHTVKSIGKGAFSDCASLESIVLGVCLAEIGHEAFLGCRSLACVYHYGKWDKLKIGSDNEALQNAKRYFYRETKPEDAGNYWHWVDDEPTPW